MFQRVAKLHVVALACSPVHVCRAFMFSGVIRKVSYDIGCVERWQGRISCSLVSVVEAKTATNMGLRLR